MDCFFGHVNAINDDLGLGEKISGHGVVIIRENHHPFDTGRNQGFSASGAGHIGHIGRRTINGMTATGGLDYSIHLGVDRAHTMIVYQQTARIRAMLIAGDGAIVPRGDDIFIFD